MKVLNLSLLALLLAGCFWNEARAQDNGVNGLLLGAGGGALVGQAIGRDTEGTLIGTAVGGMLGYIAGNEMDKNSYGQVYAAPQPVFYPSPPPSGYIYHNQPPRHPRYYPYRPQYRDHYRYSKRPVTICRDIVVVREHHGRYRETIKTVCRDRDDRRYYRHHRSPYPHDRYGYRDRW